MNKVMKPNKEYLEKQTLLKKLARWILSNIEGTPEQRETEMERMKKY